MIEEILGNYLCVLWFNKDTRNLLQEDKLNYGYLIAKISDSWIPEIALQGEVLLVIAYDANYFEVFILYKDKKISRGDLKQ